ncbi:MAG: WYL domain-containing protein [Clostridia bacterium]|nr:WYL domain-containing protein [Clostridia bacterium]
MIFKEWYGVYYRTIAKIITAILSGNAEERDLQELVREYAFGESALTILPALREEKWQLLRRDMTTPLKHPPSMPLTLIQKRWLKAVSLDPRIRLFDFQAEGLEDVAPLFTQEDYRIYDQYQNGDPYGDGGYIERFRMLTAAVREKKPVLLTVRTNGRLHTFACMPEKLEYSEKDDKFRLTAAGAHRRQTVNLAKILSCEPYSGKLSPKETEQSAPRKILVLSVHDGRNALERVMLHFAHFEKQAEKISKTDYVLRLWYDPNDEAELVIRILSFGPMVKVLEPESFILCIREKLRKQQRWEL